MAGHRPKLNPYPTRQVTLQGFSPCFLSCTEQVWERLRRRFGPRVAFGLRSNLAFVPLHQFFPTYRVGVAWGMPCYLTPRLRHRSSAPLEDRC